MQQYASKSMKRRARRQAQHCGTKQKQRKTKRTNKKAELCVEECMHMIDRLIHKNEQLNQNLVREKSQLWRNFSKAVYSHWLELLQLLASQQISSTESEQNSFNSGSSSHEIDKVVKAVNSIIECRVKSTQKRQQLLYQGIQIHKQKRAKIEGESVKASAFWRMWDQIQ